MTVRIYGIDDRNKNETAEETMSLVIKFLKDKLDIDAHVRDIQILLTGSASFKKMGIESLFAALYLELLEMML